VGPVACRAVRLRLVSRANTRFRCTLRYGRCFRDHSLERGSHDGGLERQPGMSETTATTIDRLERTLERLPGAFALIVGLTGVALVAAVDYATGTEIGLWAFYLVPVAYAAWFGGRWLGLATALTAASVWGVVDVLAGVRYSHALIPAWNALMLFVLLAIAAALLSELHGARAKARSHARTDTLTGVASGRVFEESVAAEIARSVRSGRAFTLAYIDLDNFRAVNDALGHGTADELLATVSAGLLEKLRGVDVVGRLGGDEFGLLFPETDDPYAAVVLERVMRAVSEGLAASGTSIEIGATIGAAVFATPPKDAKEAIRIAETLMNEGKRLGGGRVVIHRG
jgi:diguanylate cyclase (GGDEF)-like protein